MADLLGHRRVFGGRWPWRRAGAKTSDIDQADGNGSLATKLARGSVAAFVIYVAGAGITYFAQLALARVIGAEGYGIYAYVFAWTSVLAFAATLGFNVSLLRFIPAYQARQAWSLLRGVIQYASRRTVAAGCGIAVIGSAIVLDRADQPPVLATTFLIGFALVPIMASLWVRGAVVRALGGVVSALAPDRLVRDAVLLCLIGLASAGAWQKADAPSAMVATVIGAAVGLGLVSFAMQRLMPPAAAASLPTYETQTWRQTALPLVVIGAANILMNRTGVLLLGWIASTKDAGIYALAFNFALVAALPQTAVNALLTPAISDLFVRDERAALRSVIVDAAVWTLIASAGTALPIAILAKPLLAMFGHDFVAGATVLRVLLIGQVFVAGFGSQLYLLTMTGHERSAAALLACGVALNMALGAVLIGSFGPTGAAVAAATAMITLNAALAFSVWKNLRFLPGIFAAPRWRKGQGPQIVRPSHLPDIGA